MTSKGLQGLAYWHNGMKQLSTNKDQLQRPEDVKGLKFRIQASDVLEAQFRRSAPTRRRWPSAEVYQALQTGVVDGQENTWSNIYSQKFFEVQKTIAETNHGVIDYMVVTNAKWWDGLPADVAQGPARKRWPRRPRTATSSPNDINEGDKKRSPTPARRRSRSSRKDDVAAWQQGDGAGLEEVRGRHRQGPDRRGAEVEQVTVADGVGAAPDAACAGSNASRRA